MKLLPKTWALVVLAIFLLGINLLDRGSSAGLEDLLPRIPSLDRELATRIEITSVTEKIVMEREPGVGDDPATWRITAPLQYEADAALVMNVLGAFRKEIPMDVQVDSENDETYGLDANNSLVVEVWAAGEDPTVSVIVGFDTVGGSSFVRVSGDEGVYRARVGGRARYAVPSAGWRNRALLAYDPQRVVGIDIARTIEPGAPEIHLLRTLPVAGESPGEGPALVGPPSDWQLDPDPGWPVDQAAVNGLATGLAQLRADEILDPAFEGGFSPPAGEVTLGLDDGKEAKLTIGTRLQGTAAFVKVAGREDVFRIPADVARILLRPLADYRDKTLLQFPPTELETLSLAEGRTRVVLRQDLATRRWQVVEPQNVDTDIKLVMFAVQTLSNLRALDVAPVDVKAAGLDRPSSRFEITFFDGTAAGLDVGADVPGSDELVYVRKAGSSTVLVLAKKTVQGLRRAFGKG